MSKKRIETPPSYFKEIERRVSWEDILKKCGIKIRKKRKGSGLIMMDEFLVTLCPFHKEKTPSMSFSLRYDFFYCHGACGNWGDKFDFMVAMLNEPCHYNKVRAYHWFKKNFNISLPWEKSNGRFIYR